MATAEKEPEDEFQDSSGDEFQNASDDGFQKESDEDFDLGRLYALDPETFHLALDILEEWRIGGYAEGMAKLFRLSAQVDRMSLS